MAPTPDTSLVPDCTDRLVQGKRVSWPAMASFRFEGQRLAYGVHGRGRHTTVILPGLLLSQKMQVPLARALAREGNRVITFDPLGHGRSARPIEPWRYSMRAFADQTLGLLDHLGIERAVLGGTSLGANATLEVASRAPERLAGMVIEMPVLDHAIAACGAAFTPLLLALQFGTPAMRALASAARLAERLPWVEGSLAEVMLDWVAQDPEPSAAVLSGILYGRVAPDHRERARMQTPALVIGHPRDPVHPFSDAGMLASELPDARLLQARSVFELRVRPQRLTAAIAAFIADCWTRPPAAEPALTAA
jgi:pimeloyl-ACP methyl ester carboxylesterase